MLTANELRVGNWLIMLVNGQFRFTKISASTIVDIAATPQELIKRVYQPIKLNISILHRAGFYTSKSGTDMFNLGYTNTEYPATLQPSNPDKMLICRSGLYAYGAPCKYLHTLQNLYYALKGKELQIDMKNLPLDFGNLMEG